MGKAFAVLIKRFERHLGQKPEFYAVTEQTKRGEPHLHVLMRCGYIPQRLVSQWWQELTGARIVDIRRVKDAKKAARYVAKYLAKGLHKFGNSKRYWSSRGWLLPAERQVDEEPWVAPAWKYSKEHIEDIEWSHRKLGWWRVPGELRGGIIKLMRPRWLWGTPAGPPGSVLRC